MTEADSSKYQLHVDSLRCMSMKGLQVEAAICDAAASSVFSDVLAVSMM